MGILPVIGGGDAPAGAWPDVAALRDGTGKLLCTGTLVAPTIVLTAGHCDRTDLVDVLIGTDALDHPERGEVITVLTRLSYPSAASSEDVAALVLARPSVMAPRALASGWAAFDIANGARAVVVGYGATDAAGTVFVPALQQGMTTITDFDCATSHGCNAGALPAGELGAGGMGIDACPGDSGGPLYLPTAYGTFLAGVTSRGYDGQVAVCGGGSIYARADAVLGWLEQATGVAMVHGPEPAAPAIAATLAAGGETIIDPRDPRDTGHRFAIVAQPAHGTAKVRGDGTVRVCPAAAGDDAVTIAIADASDPTRSLALAIPIHATGDAGPCDVSAFSDGRGDGEGGCCDSGRSGGGPLALAVVVFGALRRRRRC
jgi:uncharacterized protein (TIGR03382 family)